MIHTVQPNRWPLLTLGLSFLSHCSTEGALLVVGRPVLHACSWPSRGSWMCCSPLGSLTSICHMKLIPVWSENIQWEHEQGQNKVEDVLQRGWWWPWSRFAHSNASRQSLKGLASNHWRRRPRNTQAELCWSYGWRQQMLVPRAGSSAAWLLHLCLDSSLS